MYKNCTVTDAGCVLRVQTHLIVECACFDPSPSSVVDEVNLSQYTLLPHELLDASNNNKV